jgi:hypothetical protein
MVAYQGLDGLDDGLDGRGRVAASSSGGEGMRREGMRLRRNAGVTVVNARNERRFIVPLPLP